MSSSKPEPRPRPSRLRVSLVSLLRRRLGENAQLRRILFNINWLFAQRFVDGLIGLAVGIAVLRYLGPERYGILSYVGSVVALGVPFAMLGLNNIVVRRLVTQREQAGEILGTAVGLRFVAALAVMALVLLATRILRPEDPRIFLFAAMIATGHVLASASVVSTWFQATVEAKFNVIARSGAKTVFALLKLAFVLMAAPLSFFVAAVAGELVLASVLLVLFYATRAPASLRRFSFRRARARSLLAESWPLSLSGFMTIVYLRTDQVMLGQMLSDQAVGVYAAAVRLSGLLYVVPGIITGSVFPALLKTRDRDHDRYRERLQLLYDGLLWLSIASASLVTVAGPWIVPLLFGAEYTASTAVLAIHVWSAIFLFVGSASQKYLIAEQLTRITLICTSTGAAINLGANALLIPMYGVDGAAYATLLSTFFSHVVALGLFPQSRPTLGFVLHASNPFAAAGRWLAAYRAGAR